MRGLLDLTDTIAGGKVVPPPDVVRYDDDDPYLVVAADKGTATFSDIANAISIEYGFWLGDAFASGGSAGYDHKQMGITARGAWESVKRHFRELGTDIETTDFTVVGIGDMSGDVFGNGMLLSRHIRLVGAFDHRHVFLDPDPGSRPELRRARAPVPAAALVLGRLRPGADLARRRRLPAHGEVDPALGRGPGGARGRGGGADAERADPRAAPRTGRPALERRHRHLREGAGGAARRGRRPRERRRPRRRRGAALPRRRRGRQPRRDAAGADRVRARRRPDQHGRDRQLGAASTAPTTRSTSRSCSTRSSPTAT